MKDVTAKLRYLRIAPRKVRVVADSIRGKSVRDAEIVLRFVARRAHLPLEKLLKSAVANAKHNFHMQPETLVIKSIRVDQGPVLKRRLLRARGMATPIRKKSSHITLVLGVKS